MASQATTNGLGSSDGSSFAQQLMSKHFVGDGHSHNVTIEDATDDEDTPAPGLNGDGASAPLSEKAAGKQAESASAPKPPAKAPLDTQSEELFPSLGAPKSTAPPAATWSRKPAVTSIPGAPNGKANGLPSHPRVASGTSTPKSGFMTPTSGAAQTMNLPGRYVEAVSFAPSQLTPRNQLKKPLPEVLRDITKKSKVEIKLSTGPDNKVIFQGTGPSQDAVRQALKEVAKQIGSKQSTKVTIPASVRPHIIGKGGAVIQKLSQRSGARIEFDKRETANTFGDDDDGATVDVLIEGDAVSAEMARREIEAIVDERTSTVNLRLRDIPQEFYPFLAGPNHSLANQLQEGRDLRLQIPHYHRWVDEAPPQAPAHRQPVQFVAQGRQPISISGDRKAAIEVRAELQRQVEQLRRQLTSDQMAIERGRHQFIIGEKGAELHKFLEETGCAIIFPPADEDSEMLTVVGPADKIEEGMNRIMDLASDMAMASVDIARQHPNAPNGAQNYARHVTRYLQQRRALETLERAHQARIVAQAGLNAPTAWEVYSKEGKNAMRARSDIMSVISAHPPSRFAPVAVDPFFHEHLRRQAAKHVRNEYGVHLVIPDQFSDEPEVVLVYEGGSPDSFEIPRRQPTAVEVQQFQRSLQEAQRHIEQLCSGHSNIVARELDAPAKFHDKIRRHVDRRHESLSNDQIPVQVRVGAATGTSARQGSGPSIAMRGPEADVDELVKVLLAFIEQEEKDELERGFTLDFEFPKQYANQLIGKSGSNIKKLRDEFDVDIQVNDGKVEIKGPEAKANACKAHIKALERKLADEATYTLKIASQFHKDLIGPKGAQVNRLQDRYKVRINFPRSTDSDDDVSVADGQAPKRSVQAADEVIVKGPKKGADEARDELLSLLSYVKDNSNVTTVSVAQSQIPSLIGSRGRELEALRLATGAQIDIPNNKDETDGSARVEIRIKGTKTAVEAAKKRIEESAKVYDNTVTREVQVDKKHHGAIIGGGGEGIRKLVLAAGGPDDRQKINRMVRFPPASATESSFIRVEGPQAIADKIVAQIEELVAQRDSQTTEILEVAPEKHRQLIGRGGDVRKRLESQFSIALDIPKQDVTGAARSQVKVTGQPADVQKAIAHISDLVKDQETTTLQIPQRYHHTVSENGGLFRRLRKDHRVSIDHAGTRPPTKQAAPAPKREGALPLITDDAPASSTHSWTSHTLASQYPAGDIPWVLSGPSAADVAKAAAKLEAALAEAGRADTTGLLILADPAAHKLVIGPHGATINRIRKETGTKITVPPAGSGEEAIEIVGSAEGVEKARDEILTVLG